MSNSLFKKASAAAIMAVLGAGASARAASVVPYSTGFENPPYLSGSALSGTVDGATAWATNVGSAGTATISVGTGIGASQSTGFGSSFGSYNDVFNTGTALSTSDISSLNSAGRVYKVSFSLNRAIPTGGETTAVPNTPTPATPTRTGFGIEVLDGSANHQVVASLFVRNSLNTVSNPSVPRLFVNDVNGAANNQITGAAGTPALDGSYGTYSLNLNFSTKTFDVIGPNGISGPFAFATFGVDLSNGLEGVALADDGSGTNTGFFDNFSAVSAVPEPVSVAMIGVGSLLLAGRRRRVTV